MSTNNEDKCGCCNLKKSKRCNKCDVMKSLTEFDTGRKICKECRKSYNAKKYQMLKDIKSVDKVIKNNSI